MANNYIGEVIDFLKIVGGPISKESGKKIRLFWECECVCGKTLTVRQDNLGSRTHSCGCKQHVVLEPKERFMRHIEVTPQSCWVWKGAVDRDKKGIFAIVCTPIKIVRATKASLTLLRPEQGGVTDAILNKCATWNCVNPDHLFVREPEADPDSASA